MSQPSAAARLARAVYDYVRAEFGPQSRPVTVTIALDGLPAVVLPVLPMPPAAAEAPADREAPSPPPFRTGPGCRSLRDGPTVYAFTEPQSKAVELLFQAWEAGTPDVPDSMLLRATGSEAVRLADVFRACDAWGKILTEGETRGTHRLAPRSGAAPAAPAAELLRGPEFRSVRWGGECFSFTAPQARAVQALYAAWEAGTPDVPDTTALHACGSEAAKLADVFRGSAAWRTLIIEGGTRGTHRLAPDPPGVIGGRGPAAAGYVADLDDESGDCLPAQRPGAGTAVGGEASP